MTTNPDALIDRRRLKRHLNTWRVVAVVALVVALLAGARPTGVATGRHIERYRIEGLIGDGQKQIEELGKLAKDSNVAAVLLHLNTPGGAVSGGEGIHQAVRDLAAKKPVVAVMDGVAASAGYMIAVATPHIVARESTITGSIGVLMQLANFGPLLDKIGVSTDALVSGPLKGQPSFDKPLSPAGREVLQGMIADLYDQFVGMVATGRHMDAARIRALADGRAYTGRQAIKLGLVDELGGEAEARKWLAAKRDVPESVPVTEPDKRPWTERLAAQSLAGILVQARQAFGVDGPMAVWQPFPVRN